MQFKEDAGGGMKRLNRFLIDALSYGAPFWLVMSGVCIILTLAAPWYLGWITAIAAVFYYDMAMEE